MRETDDELDAIRQQKRDAILEAATRPREPVHIESEAHLREVVSTGVVLVDFYADWCGPCKMLEPTVAEIAAETDATVAKVDIDAHQAIATQYRVQGVPTLYLFSGGEPVERLVGVQDKGRLVELVDQVS